jgi:hypothetical protein
LGTKEQEAVGRSRRQEGRSCITKCFRFSLQPSAH